VIELKPPSLRGRICLSVLIGVLSALYALVLADAVPVYGMDFDPIRYAARGLLHGENPYELIGPGRVGEWPWLLFYPLTALLVVTPFVALPLVVARAAFVGIGGALLAFVVTRRSWNFLPLFVSAAYLSVVQWGQWSAYLSAATMLPALGFLATVKPNIGLAVLASARSWRALRTMLIGCLLLVAASFVVEPGWFAEWRGAIGKDSGHVSTYVLRPGGVLLLLAALRWRRWEARLLLAFAIIPQNPGIHETLLLFTIPASAIGTGSLALATHAVDHWVSLHEPYATFAAGAVVRGNFTLLLVLVPCLIMVLRRPNEGALPTWMERRAMHLPRWLRGRSPGPFPDARVDASDHSV
jgi:hypothetical protein